MNSSDKSNDNQNIRMVDLERAEPNVQNQERNPQEDFFLAAQEEALNNIMAQSNVKAEDSGENNQPESEEKKQEETNPPPKKGSNSSKKGKSKQTVSDSSEGENDAKLGVQELHDFLLTEKDFLYLEQGNTIHRLEVVALDMFLPECNLSEVKKVSSSIMPMYYSKSVKGFFRVECKNPYLVSNRKFDVRKDSPYIGYVGEVEVDDIMCALSYGWNHLAVAMARKYWDSCKNPIYFRKIAISSGDLWARLHKIDIEVASKCFEAVSSKVFLEKPPLERRSLMKTLESTRLSFTETVYIWAKWFMNYRKGNFVSDEKALNVIHALTGVKPEEVPDVTRVLYKKKGEENPGPFAGFDIYLDYANIEKFPGAEVEALTRDLEFLRFDWERLKLRPPVWYSFWAHVAITKGMGTHEMTKLFRVTRDVYVAQVDNNDKEVITTGSLGKAVNLYRAIYKKMAATGGPRDTRSDMEFQKEKTEAQNSSKRGIKKRREFMW